jgi:hypothetical protein
MTPAATAQQPIDRTAAPPPTREQINELEEHLRQFEQLPWDLDHTFAPGLYIRTLRIPAGAVAVGKIHKTEHIFILSKGRILVVTEDGRQEFEAPYQAICRPGLKRAVYALTDVVVTNVHITDETDLEQIEAAVIEKPALQAAAQPERLS